MKRLATQPITTFFQRKQPRRNEDVESVDSDSDQEEQTQENKQEQKRPRSRAQREDLVGILQRRELVGCSASRQFVDSKQTLRRRRKQQLVRWALSKFQRLPVELQLSPHWERQAGALSSEEFYASCLEFDAQGVLLAAGASNGIIALYDFDDVFHRSINLGQRMREWEKAKEEDDAVEQEEAKPADEILHPIHTIFVPFEVKRIRWNPLNEDEIACSFSNRNEIHVFNLRKFPTKPHKVLKSSSHPSSGYNDLLYLSPSEDSRPPSRQQHKMKTKPREKTSNIIAGDMDGAIRMWDPRFPLRPVWSFLTSSQPINSLVLSANKQFLVCGNEAGVLMTYDIKHKVVPAFGSKSVPQRKASVNVMDAIKPYLSPACIEAVLLSSRSGSPGIVSIRLAPHSDSQVLCQLRNDWVVVIDYLLGSVVKLHTSLRGSSRRDKSKSGLPASVLTMLTESEYNDLLPRSFRNSWLSSHRCSGTLLFDRSIMCTGIHDATSLHMIDLHQLLRTETAAGAKTENGDTPKADEKNSSDSRSRLHAVERLDRFRIPMSSIITAVVAHPSQHSVICGGENMRLQVVSTVGQRVD